ncbi:MAG TPA: hypothetical protein V6C81_07725 [Planktothrix sp.]|jgi:hypothetical protein
MGAKSEKQTSTKAIAFSCLAAAAISFAVPLAANAQFAGIVKPQNDISDQISIPANTAPANPLPPPPGDGAQSPAVTAGDTGGAQGVATGNANTGPTTTSPQGTGTTRSIVRIYVNEGNNGGFRMVQTIRPDSLPPAVQQQVAGVLGVNINSGEPFIDTTVTNAQMAQLNAVLFPYPQTQNEGGRLFINSDTPAAGYPKEQALYQFQGPLPTVKTFARYLVLLGVVCSTIFMALAGAAIVLGHPYAGSKAFGAASGLMLLLMGYSIWKIVQMNTFNANSSPPAVITQDAGGGTVNPLPNTTVPGVPNAAGGGVARSPLPVAPLNGN